MSAFIVRLPKLRRAAQTLISDSLARLRRGERTDKFGFPIVCSLRPEELTPEDIKCLHANPPPAKKHPSQYTI